MQAIYIDLASLFYAFIVIMLFAFFALAIYREVKIDSRIEKHLDTFLPTAEELALQFVAKLTADGNVFKKFILPIIGADMKDQDTLLESFMEDNPIVTALEVLNPAAAEKVKKRPRLLLTLPTILGRINPKLGEVASQMLGAQFNILGLLAQGDVSPESASAMMQASQSMGAQDMVQAQKEAMTGNQADLIKQAEVLLAEYKKKEAASNTP